MANLVSKELTDATDAPDERFRDRRSRRAKNDALDAGKLLAMLMRYHGGEPHVWSVLRTPGEADENVRQRQRELKTLRDERTSHINRLKGLLAQQGLDVKVNEELRDRLKGLQCWNGAALPSHLRSRVERELDRIELVDQQIHTIEQQRREHERRKNDERARQVRQLCALRGIGPESAWLTVGEVFG